MREWGRAERIIPMPEAACCVCVCVCVRARIRASGRGRRWRAIECILAISRVLAQAYVIRMYRSVYFEFSSEGCGGSSNREVGESERRAKDRARVRVRVSESEGGSDGERDGEGFTRGSAARERALPSSHNGFTWVGLERGLL
jgi:hypothetical protein